MTTAVGRPSGPARWSRSCRAWLLTLALAFRSVDAAAAGAADGGTANTPIPATGALSDAGAEPPSGVVRSGEPVDEVAPQRPETFVVDQQAKRPAQRLAPRPDNANLHPDAGLWSFPGTDVQFKLGGDVSAVVLATSKLLPSQTGFLTPTIPVSGQPLYLTAFQMAATVNQSNVSFEFRMPTPVGSLRIVYDNDFYTSSSSDFVYDAVYFYLQVGNLLAGFSDSVFVDPDSWPATLDYQGVTSDVFKRHLVLRYTLVVFRHLDKDLFINFSVEQPGSQIPTLSGTVPRDAAPDGVVAIRLEGPIGHVQLSTVLRALGSQEPSSGEHQSALGWGVSLAGAMNLWAGDVLTAGVAGGHGLAAYFHGTGGLGLDAAFTSSGQLVALPILGTYLGYTRRWTARWSSTASYGYLVLDDASTITSLGTTALRWTQYASLNLVFRPWKPFLLGVEGLWGNRAALDGARGDAWRGQLDVQYSF